MTDQPNRAGGSTRVGSRRVGIILLSLIIGAVTAAPVAAAPKGNRGGGKATPTVTIEGDLTVGNQVTIYGEGFKRSAPVFIVPNDQSASVLVETDKRGNLTATWTVSSTEASKLSFYQLAKKNDWDMAVAVPITVNP